jgi:hypothetical protein
MYEMEERVDHRESAESHCQERSCHRDVRSVLDSDNPDIRSEIEQKTHLEVCNTRRCASRIREVTSIITKKPWSEAKKSTLMDASLPIGNCTGVYADFLSI